MATKPRKKSRDADATRPRVDPEQLNIIFAAVGYYYLTNRVTGSILDNRGLMAPEALDERLRFDLDTVLHMVCADPA